MEDATSGRGGSEREQIFLCARIALGSEATWRERRMAVLYDLLRFTDDERVTRICRLLAKDSEASRRPMRRIRP